MVGYNKPLNWSCLYRPAMEHITEKYGYHFVESDYKHAIDVLTKYNTRINPRELEVSSAQIFTEILDGIHVPPADLEQIKHSFYTYFRRDASVYPAVESILKILCDKGILPGTLSDVAYGMDNVYVWDDILSLRQYIHYPLASNDVGYRKPCIKGIELLAAKMNIRASEMIFVGDEEKDTICAKNANAYAVFINREVGNKDYAQDAEIHGLDGLLNYFPSFSAG